MKKLVIYLVLTIATGCSTQNEIKSWVDSETDLSFTDFWGYCHHVYAKTEDNSWLLRVKVNQNRGKYSMSDTVTLIDLRLFNDKEYEVSLYKGNDIRIERDKKIAIQATSGDVKIHHEYQKNIWESRVNVELNNVVFVHASKMVTIKSAFFSNLPISVFCGG